MKRRTLLKTLAAVAAAPIGFLKGKSAPAVVSTTPVEMSHQFLWLGEKFDAQFFYKGAPGWGVKVADLEYVGCEPVREKTIA